MKYNEVDWSNIDYNKITQLKKTLYGCGKSFLGYS